MADKQKQWLSDLFLAHISDRDLLSENLQQKAALPSNKSNMKDELADGVAHFTKNPNTTSDMTNMLPNRMGHFDAME